MTVSRIGVAVGASALKFNVLDHFGYGANPNYISKSTTSDFGALMYVSGQGEVSICSGDMAASAQYAGFCESKVVDEATMTTSRIDVHGELALVDVDKVAIWQRGRYRVTLVSGTVADNALVYPAANGYVSTTKVGSAPVVGVARKGNGGVAGDPIEVEIDLFAHGA